LNPTISIPTITNNTSSVNIIATQSYVDSSVSTINTLLNNKLNISANALSSDESSGTSSVLYTNPLTQGKHKSACKAYANFSPSGTIYGSYNVSSVSKVSTGNYLITFTIPFLNTNYACSADCENTGLLVSCGIKAGSQNLNNITIQVVNTLGLFDAPGKVHAIFFGDV
jgi:hypothetical protein